MVQSRWRLDRIARMEEAEAFDQLLNVPAADGKSDEAALVALYPLRGALLDKLQRYTRDNERAYHRAVRELKQYRKAQAEENKSEPAEEQPARNEANTQAVQAFLTDLHATRELISEWDGPSSRASHSVAALAPEN